MKNCTQCGTTITSDSPEGLCARCLLSVAMQTDASETVDSPASQTLPPSRSPQTPADIDIADSLEVAKRLPQFEIMQLLGRGGMGVVYKARQIQLDRIVALKILPPTEANSPGFVERFRREARSLAKLSHPNIVHLYEFGETSGLYYFVMEFVDGANLRQAIVAHRLTPAEALAVVPKICDALQFAHEEGVVHRDIKPENILIDKKGRVKIADFGLAKLLGREEIDPRLTVTGATLGTPRYMAPEQMEKPETVDHRADIYSLGVVFYEMLTGEVPMGRFAPPSQKVQIDVRLDEIVLHALERDVELRYQQASEIKSDVESVRTDAALIAAPLTAPGSGQIACDDANTRLTQLNPLPRFFWLWLLGAMTIGWIAVAALWNFGPTGFTLGSVVMAAITLQAGRSHANRNPLWVEKIRTHRAAKRFATLFFNFFVLAVLFMMFIAGLFLLWDSSGKRANPAAPTSEEFEAKYKGKEYQLIRRLGAFKDQVPNVELSKDSIGTSFISNNPATNGWLLIIGDVLILGFFFQQSAGDQAHRVKGLRKGGWRAAFASTSTLLGGLVLASMAFSWQIFLPLNRHAMTTVNNTVMTLAKVNQASNALHRWAAKNGYESASERWGLQAVPKVERVASVEVFNAWKDSPFERWRMTASGPERPFPHVAVQITGSENPVQSEVLIYSGGYPDGMVVVGSGKEEHWQAIIKSLSDAVSKAADFDPNLMSIVKPAIAHAETSSLWPGVCGILAAMVVWVFVMVRYLTPVPVSKASVRMEPGTMSPMVMSARPHTAKRTYRLSIKVLGIVGGVILLLSLSWLVRDALREDPHTALKRTPTEPPEPTDTTSSPTAASGDTVGPATAPDLSEPLGFLRAWGDALGADDFPTAEALCVGPKETLRLMEVDSQQGLELVRLNDAMRQVFAGRNPNIASGPTAQAREAVRQMLLQATVLKADPDLAIAYPSSAKKMTLRRIDGQWKLDFVASYLPADYQARPGDLALYRGFYLLPVQRLTQDVLAGKFKTLEEATGAYHQLRSDWTRIPSPLRDDVTRKQAGEVADRYSPSTTRPATEQSPGPTTRL